MTVYTDEDKFRCAERELKLRRRAYPRWVELGKMDAKVAEREIAIMEAIAEDYRPKGML